MTFPNLSNLTWVYFLLIFVELLGIAKYLLLRKRFQTYTLTKTTFLVGKAFFRGLCFFLVVASSSELQWLSREEFTIIIRFSWLIVAIITLAFHLFDSSTMMKIK